MLRSQVNKLSMLSPADVDPSVAMEPCQVFAGVLGIIGGWLWPLPNLLWKHSFGQAFLAAFERAFLAAPKGCMAHVFEHKYGREIGTMKLLPQNAQPT
jgi:hypothetical protein